MSGCFATPLGYVWVTNGQAQSLTEAWLALSREPGSASARDEQLVGFLETRAALAEAPGLGGFAVTEPPLDVPSRRQRFAALNAELARRMSAVDFDGALLGVRWAAFEDYLRCYWLEPVEAIHLGVHASLGQEPPALGWQLDPECRAAIEVFRAADRLVSAPRVTEAQELAILQTLTSNVARAKALFCSTGWKMVEHHFFRRAQLEESAGQLKDAIATWRLLASLLSDPSEKRLAEEIAEGMECRSR